MSNRKKGNTAMARGIGKEAPEKMRSVSAQQECGHGAEAAPENRGVALPLNLMSAGKRVKVTLLTGGKALESRLCALGILPGAKLEVVSNMGGPVIVRVRGSRVSLGRGMAAKILVNS